MNTNTLTRLHYGTVSALYSLCILYQVFSLELPHSMMQSILTQSTDERQDRVWKGF